MRVSGLNGTASPERLLYESLNRGFCVAFVDPPATVPIFGGSEHRLLSKKRNHLAKQWLLLCAARLSNRALLSVSALCSCIYPIPQAAPQSVSDGKSNAFEPNANITCDALRFTFRQQHHCTLTFTLTFTLIPTQADKIWNEMHVCVCLIALL